MDGWKEVRIEAIEQGELRATIESKLNPSGPGAAAQARFARVGKTRRRG